MHHALAFALDDCFLLTFGAGLKLQSCISWVLCPVSTEVPWEFWVGTFLFYGNQLMVLRL